MKREKGTENIFENIIAERFPNLGKERDIQAQETRSRQSHYLDIHSQITNFIFYFATLIYVLQTQI